MIVNGEETRVHLVVGSGGVPVVMIDTDTPAAVRVRINDAQVYPSPEVGVLADEEIARLVVEQIGAGAP